MCVGLKKKHVDICIWVDFEKKKEKKRKLILYVVFVGKWSR